MFPLSEQVGALFSSIILPWFLQHSRAADPGWHAQELTPREKALKFRLLARLMHVSVEWRNVVTASDEYAALRLAQFDLI